jgi:hypothetical protein
MRAARLRVDGRRNAAYHRAGFGRVFLIEICNECSIDDP